MDKTHYIRRSHEQGNYEIIPTYTDQVVVTIKSLATGQTMKVYLDEPTQGVENGINYTKYTGHFYEEEFMVTLSEGVEFTGLPLMYSYWNEITSNAVIDVENHSVIIRNNKQTSQVNLLSNPMSITLIDSQDPNDTSINAVTYLFTPFGVTSPGEPDVPIVVPADPGVGSEVSSST